MNIDKIYCVNLDRRPDRWRYASAQFDAAGLQVERFQAIDSNDFKIQYPTKASACGCALSHYFIIERAKMLGFKAVMVFEDDVELKPRFTHELEKCMGDLPEDWDMLYLGGSHKAKPVPVTNNIYKVVKTLTTHAYIMRSSMFNRAIELLRNIEQPVDGIYADLQKEFNVYITNPPIAWQREGFSDIEGRNMAYDWIKTNNQ